MSQMLKSSGAMAAATLTSRVLGMVREMVYAAFMGAGWVASSFFLAFQVPNLFRRLLGVGHRRRRPQPPPHRGKRACPQTLRVRTPNRAAAQGDTRHVAGDHRDDP